MVQLSKAGLTDPSAQEHQMTYTQEGVQMHRPRGKIPLSKDTAGLPNGFIQRAELFKANVLSVPTQGARERQEFSQPHTVPCRKLHTPLGTWAFSHWKRWQTRSYVPPCSQQAGTHFQLGQMLWPCEPTAAARISPGSSCSQKHMCLMSPPGGLSQSCQKFGCSFDSSKDCRRQSRFLIPFPGFCFSSC